MLVDPSQSSHQLHMLSPINSHGVGAGTGLPPFCHQLSMLWNLSFMYKGARYCTGKFVLFSTKG